MWPSFNQSDDLNLWMGCIITTNTWTCSNSANYHCTKISSTLAPQIIAIIAHEKIILISKWSLNKSYFIFVIENCYKQWLTVEIEPFVWSFTIATFIAIVVILAFTFDPTWAGDVILLSVFLRCSINAISYSFKKKKKKKSRPYPRKFKRGIGSLFDPVLTLWGGGHIGSSRMEQSYCTSGFFRQRVTARNHSNYQPRPKRRSIIAYGKRENARHNKTSLALSHNETYILFWKKNIMQW